VRVDGLDDDQLARWTALHRAQAEVANPFASPTWVTCWYRHHVPRERQLLLWITQGDRLVGVAPLYRQEVTLARVPMARRLGLIGSGRSTPLEIPPLLCAPGLGRPVGRAVVQAALRYGVTWAELCLSREHGWLGAQEAGAQDGTAVFSRHQQMRTCVVMPLQSTWEQTRAGLRRNVKESVRRAHNRLDKDGRPWQIHHRHGDHVDAAAVTRLLDLHAARSQYQESVSHHHDAFAQPATATFLHELLPQLARVGEVSLVELELAGQIVATQLVLHPPGGIYFHSSGFLPAEWALSPVTALQVAAMRAAIDRGEQWVNFSPGPNEAKLRWSDQLAVYVDTAFGPASRSGLARYTAFFLAKDVRQLHHERSLETAAVAAGPASGATYRGRRSLSSPPGSAPTRSALPAAMADPGTRVVDAYGVGSGA
jgi:CelD/BcsL family acetyltransferase involved in cellulose biosynthesis